MNGKQATEPTVLVCGQCGHRIALLHKLPREVLEFIDQDPDYLESDEEMARSEESEESDEFEGEKTINELMRSQAGAWTNFSQLQD